MLVKSSVTRAENNFKTFQNIDEILGLVMIYVPVEFLFFSSPVLHTNT
jgi:hypothetical protein